MHHISSTSFLLFKGTTTLPVKSLNILDYILLYFIRFSSSAQRMAEPQPAGTGETDVQFEQAVMAFLVEGKKLTCIHECLLKVGVAVTVDVSTV
jgi:hypothetical protein